MEAKDILNEVTENVAKSMEPALQGKASNESVEELKSAVESKADASDIAEVKSNQETIQKGLDNLKETVTHLCCCVQLL